MVAHQVYATYPICGLDFKGEYSVELGKQTYFEIRCWLPEAHPYRLPRMVDHFNGKIQTCNKPHPITWQ
jgi:hypothetical protein